MSIIATLDSLYSHSSPEFSREGHRTKKMFSIKNFFSKCDQTTYAVGSSKAR